MPSPLFRFRRVRGSWYDPFMVTQAQLRAHTARQPFQPFWVRLADGETLYITEPFRAVVMPSRIVVSPDGDRLRWIMFDQIADHGVLSPTSSASTGNGE